LRGSDGARGFVCGDERRASKGRGVKYFKYYWAPVLLAAVGAVGIAYRWRARGPEVLAGSVVELVRVDPIRVSTIPYPKPAAGAIRPDRRLLAAAERGLAASDPVTNSNSALMHVTHLWGPEVCFPRTPGRDPIRVLDAILMAEDRPEFRTRKKPAFVDTTGRLRLRAQVLEEGPVTGEAHVDQTVAVLAGLGIPLDQPIGVVGGHATLRDVFQEVLLAYSPSSVEAEWTAIAIALYLPPVVEWRTEWGERYTIDDVARTLLARPLGEGPCDGTHNVQALCVLLRVSGQYPVLSDSTREAIVERLKTVRDRLEKFQMSSGAWSWNWAILGKPLVDEEVPDQLRWEVLLPTAHHLEWIALAPPELRPSDKAIQRAVDYCYRELATRYETCHQALKCPPTHALISVYRYYFPELMRGPWLPLPEDTLTQEKELRQ